MGSRGPRSAAQVAMSRHILPATEKNRIDIAALARINNMSTEQVMRAIRTAEKRGDAFSRLTQDKKLEWFWKDDG